MYNDRISSKHPMISPHPAVVFPGHLEVAVFFFCHRNGAKMRVSGLVS